MYTFRRILVLAAMSLLGASLALADSLVLRIDRAEVSSPGSPARVELPAGSKPPELVFDVEPEVGGGTRLRLANGGIRTEGDANLQRVRLAQDAIGYLEDSAGGTSVSIDAVLSIDSTDSAQPRLYDLRVRGAVPSAALVDQEFPIEVEGWRRPSDGREATRSADRRAFWGTVWGRFEGEESQ